MEIAWAALPKKIVPPADLLGMPKFIGTPPTAGANSLDPTPAMEMVAVTVPPEASVIVMENVPVQE
jgi:hypothetical protein